MVLEKTHQEYATSFIRSYTTFKHNSDVNDIDRTDLQRDAQREAIADEFIETGLEEKDEPNKRGRLLEDLIGRLRNP